jgi:hypothetical protein
MIIFKIIGAAILLGVLLLAGFFADAVWNGSRIFYAAMGRDRLVSDCTPLTKESLIGKGFSPTDLSFGERPSISFTSGSFGQSKTLSDDFTFSDGPDGQRVDGGVVCTVVGKTVKVEVHVDSLPQRAT